MFYWRNDHKKIDNRFVWFKKWVMDRQVYRTLEQEMQMDKRSISRLFKQYLSQAPAITIKSKEAVHLLIDGTYFPNKLCLILYYDHDIRYVQLYRTSNKEKLREIQQDLKALKELGVNVHSVTCDGHISILRGVSKVFPQAIIQRCLVHIKRQSKAYLRAKPKLQASIDLLKISQQITCIKTPEQCSYWLLSLHNWYQWFKEVLTEQSVNMQTGRYWFTHKNLHQAYTLIYSALPNMFHYLDDPQIPCTTNRLESYFKHLKEKLLLHSGLRLEAKRSFIKWYLHFKNNTQ